MENEQKTPLRGKSTKESIWKYYCLTSGKNFQTRSADYTISHY